jgi:uncharacterized membrane protein (DUF485 family)
MEIIIEFLKCHELLTLYLIGYVVATVWTTVWLLREKVKESYGFRILFAAIMGLLSWVIVCIYLMVYFGEKDNKNKR